MTYSTKLPTATVNPQLVIDIGDDAAGGIDQAVDVTITLSATTPTTIEISTPTPLYYLTGALGFDTDAVNSLATTLDATLNAYRAGGRPPAFPAPPRPPPGS